MKQTILLTGFGPFPGVPVNLSSQVVKDLAPAAQRTFPNVRIIHATLPTEWLAAPILLKDLINQHRPALALHFGVSHQAHGLAIETTARNAADHMDASGWEPDDLSLFPGLPNNLQTTLPVARIVDRLRRLGFPGYVSHDAGDYLCNAIFFHSLAMCDPNSPHRYPQANCDLPRSPELRDQRAPHMTSGFIHIPTRFVAASLQNESGSRPSHNGRLTQRTAVLSGLEIIATALKLPLVRHR